MGGEDRGGEIDTVPTLETARLSLRPFTLADAPRVHALVNDQRIAAMTLNIPHPYPAGAAERWIAGHAPGAAAGTLYSFAIARQADGLLVGAIGLVPELRHRRAEIGYWLGVDYWNQGYMSEAARCVVAFGFTHLGLQRIQATCLPHNPASAKVMQHAGMQYEGLLRSYTYKDGIYNDIAMYAIVRGDEGVGSRQ